MIDFIFIGEKLKHCLSGSVQSSFFVSGKPRTDGKGISTALLSLALEMLKYFSI